MVVEEVLRGKPERLREEPEHLGEGGDGREVEK